MAQAFGLLPWAGGYDELLRLVRMGLFFLKGPSRQIPNVAADSGFISELINSTQTRMKRPFGLLVETFTCALVMLARARFEGRSGLRLLR